MSEYTKKGHALKHIEGMVFECLNERSVGWDEDRKYFQAGPFTLARMLLFAPCTQGQMVATLRAWLTAYDDEELLCQVDEVVRLAIDKLSPPGASTPLAPTQQKQGMN